jgi:hypothetical protein
MGHALTLEIPDHVYESLVKRADMYRRRLVESG